MEFFETTSDDAQYKYKILVYPNITYQSDLEKDSFVVVIGNIIKELAEIRDDLYWTLILPKHIQSLDLKNTEQIYYEYPTYPNSMRCHFDFNKMMKLLDWKNNEWDIVYTHLPEHTLQLKNLLYNTTNCKPLFCGYTHWSEFPEITNYEQTLLDVNLLGLAEMVECGINTIGQKNLVLKNAKTHFNDEFVNKLDGIVKPHYLGWGIPEYDTAEAPKEKVIVFNHRPHEYKSYPWFIKMMDKLREHRTDFKVWVPLAEKPDRDYFFIGKNKTRREYLTTLSNCHFGVCGKQKYAGWAVSATDGMSVGVPYLFYDADYYHELASTAGVYFNDDEDFIAKCNSYLDDYRLHTDHSVKSIKRFHENTWEHNIHQFNQMIDSVSDKLRVISETDSYKKIVKFILDNGNVSKRDITEYMGWGVRISFTDYRNRLRQEPNIIFTKDRYIRV